MILFYSMGYSRDVNGRFTFIIRDFFYCFPLCTYLMGET